MSDRVTNGVRVQVQSQFVAEESRPEQSHYFFVYHITIRNEGTEGVQLLSRHWIITDANGNVEEVRGPGVVGRQPVLRPGDSFQYTSGCPLGTPIGTMHGTYQMISSTGTSFDVEIAPFTLADPYAFN